MTESAQYDVALSFAGEQRAHVEAVAARLKASGVRVFFDDFEQVALWGHDLAVHLDSVYREKARYVVPFVSKEYAVKAWPQHEFRSALAKAVESREPYILPVRFDDTALPGLRPTIAYLDARKRSPEAVADAILERLGVEHSPTPVPPPVRLPRVAPKDFNPIAEAEGVVAHLRQELTRRAELLRQKGYVVHPAERDGRFTLRILQSGRTLYGLDIWIGGEMGENTICFYGGLGERVSPGSMNAYGTIEWSRYNDGPAVKLFNLSLLPEPGRERSLTVGELTEAIWTEVCDHLEKAAG